MRVANRVRCTSFPCSDVYHEPYRVPSVDINPASVTVVMVSEGVPSDPTDYYYAKGKPLFEETTVLAFGDAGADVASIRDILRLGVYLTTAVKCAKRGAGIGIATIDECSHLLEKEFALFAQVKAYLLMGDVAIRSLNQIAKRQGEPRVVPSGSTYKIRSGEFHFRGARVFPSYLQAGPSFFIEKTKRKMIAQDIAAALSLAA